MATSAVAKDIRQVAAAAWSRLGHRVSLYLRLTKPRITVMTLFVAAATFVLAWDWAAGATAPGGAEAGGVAATAADGETVGGTEGVGAASAFPWLTFTAMVVGVLLFAAGIFSLNHAMEPRLDGRMGRTRGRPLPGGELSQAAARRFGGALLTSSVLLLAAGLNPLCGILAVLTAAVYLGVYTPLKTRTPLHTTLGAFAGATPPLLGWAAATAGLSGPAWWLAAILFFWQFPHFLAIEIRYRGDYRAAGVKVLPATDRSGRWVRFQVAAGLIGLLAVSLGPALSPVAAGVSPPASFGYLAAALGAGALFVAAGIEVLLRYDERSARHLLRASIIYLPVVFAALALAV
jgi:protoheme IX farnesyltransferase